MARSDRRGVAVLTPALLAGIVVIAASAGAWAQSAPVRVATTDTPLADEAPPAPAAAKTQRPKRIKADPTTTGAITPPTEGEAGAPAPAKAAKPRRKTPVGTASLAPVREPVPFRAEPGIVNWYRERGGLSLPSGDRLVYCHGFECNLRTTVPLGPADLAELEAIFATRRGSAAEERDAIDHAVQWWEKRAAPLLGGPPDIRGSEPGHAHKRGQTDCLDEATNSTTILVHLQRKGLLRYHHVTRPDSRGGFLYAHATAVFTEIGGKDWVVDSWMRDMGDPNDVMTHEEWSSKH